MSDAGKTRTLCGRKCWDGRVCELRLHHRGACSWSWTRRLAQKRLPFGSPPVDGKIEKGAKQ